MAAAGSWVFLYSRTLAYWFLWDVTFNTALIASPSSRGSFDLAHGEIDWCG
jgi:hypothetical protein